MRPLFIALLTLLLVVGCSQEQSLVGPENIDHNVNNFEVNIIKGTGDDSGVGNLSFEVRSVITKPKNSLAKTALVEIPEVTRWAYQLYGDTLIADTFDLVGNVEDIEFDINGIPPGLYGVAFYTIGANQYGAPRRVHSEDTGTDAFRILSGDTTDINMDVQNIWHQLSCTFTPPVGTKTVQFVARATGSTSMYTTDSESVDIGEPTNPGEITTGVPIGVGTAVQTFYYIIYLRLYNVDGTMTYLGIANCTIDRNQDNTFSIDLEEVTGMGSLEPIMTVEVDGHQSSFSVNPPT